MQAKKIVAWDNMVYISNNLTNTQSLTLNSANQAGSLLKVGQVLSATIEQVQGKQVQLSIGNQTLVATSKEPIQSSGTVQVQVKQTQPSIELAIVNANKPSNSLQAQQALQTAYRQFIPNQTGLSQAFQQISLIQALPPSLLAPVNQLLDQALKAGSPLSGRDLKNKLSESGLFMESKLKQTDKPNLSNDVKAQLLTLKQQADNLNVKTPSPPLAQLAGLLTQAINRLTVQQLQLYENPYITPLDLPFDSNKQINKNYIEFRKNDHSSPPSWEIVIETLLPQGELSTKLMMNPQGEISCLFWCETDTLEQLISEQLDTLTQNFADNDLNIKMLKIVEQKPTHTAQTTQVAIIDIHI